MSQDDDKDPNKEMTKTKRNLLLGGVLSNSLSGDVAGDQYRRYIGSVTSTTVLNGITEQNVKRIMYEIGLRDSKSKSKTSEKIPDANKLNQSVKVGEILDIELIALHKKISNFDGKYEFMDLSSVLFALGRAISHYNNTGTLDTAFIRDGHPLMLRSLGTAFDPITSSPNSVFIPRLTSRIMAPSTFCALVSASNSSGSTVYSDMVEVDGNNAATMLTFSNGYLAAGCFEAVRLIFLMYSNMDEGSVAALAFTRGLHFDTTVVGHTDEGGFMRDVLRSGGYTPSYGAVYAFDTSSFIAFPSPGVGDRRGIAAVVDSILLTTAAGVALCDPGVSVGKNILPTVYTENKNETAQYASLHISKINLYGRFFFDRYATFLARVFGLSCNSKKASMFLAFSSSVLSRSVNCSRHLNFETVSPFFWIEPSSIIKVKQE